jgi:hypothetical protein
LVSSPSFGHPISFQEVLGTLRGFYSYDAPISSSEMREQSLKSDIQKQIISEIRKSVSPFLELPGTYIALCWPSNPSSKLSPTFSYAPFRWIHYSELLNGVKRVAIVSDVDPL